MIAIALYREDLECSQVPIPKAAALQPQCDLPSRNLSIAIRSINANATWQPRSVDRELVSRARLSHGKGESGQVAIRLSCCTISSRKAN